MPKSKRRKGGKQKAQQFGKVIRDKRIGKKIQQERLFDELRLKYQEQYTQQVKDELAKRDANNETAQSEVDLDATKEYVPDFLGKSTDLFESVKTTKK